MLVMNFAFSEDRQGNISPLPPNLGDVLALAEAVGVLRKSFPRLVSQLFNRDERWKEVDFFCKVYYPIFVASSNKGTLVFDGLKISQSRINEQTFDEQSGVLGSRIFEFPLLDDLESLKIPEFSFGLINGDIEDGLAVPPNLAISEARNQSDEFFRIFDNNNANIVHFKNQLSLAEKKYNNEFVSAREDYSQKQNAFNSIIEQKNEEMRKQIIDSESNAIKKRKQELRTELSKPLEELKDLKAAFEGSKQELNALRGIYGELIEQQRRLIGSIESADNEIFELSSIKDVAKNNDTKMSLTIDQLKQLISKRDDLKNQLQNLNEKMSENNKKIASLNEDILLKQKELKNRMDRERMAPSKEALELNKIDEQYERGKKMAMDELSYLYAERDRQLMKINSREIFIKNTFRAEKEKIEFRLGSFESSSRLLKEFILDKHHNFENSVELVYVPLYILSQEEKMSTIKPPIIIKKGGGILKYGRMNFTSRIVSHIESNWELLSVLMGEGRETFDLIGGKRKQSILRDINYLYDCNILGRLQKMLLIERCFSR